jgi:tRNA A-37 threonylcarbamoyl transferase component Bud32
MSHSGHDDDVLSFAAQIVAQQPYNRAIGVLHGTRRIWIKQAAPYRARLWHRVQAALALILRWPILRPTASPGGGVALMQEAERLHRFKACGIAVPDVLAQDGHMLVLADLGPQLQSCLDSCTDPETRRMLLHRALEALAQLHRAGLCHGRPYLRDMTWDGTRIGFLDLEEDPASIMPLPMAQARDIWIFLCSAAGLARGADDRLVYAPDLIDCLFQYYRNSGGDAAVMAALSHFVQRLAPLGRILRAPALWRRIGTDARQAVFVTERLAFLSAMHRQ